MAYENKTRLPSVTTIISTACATWIPSEYFTEDSRDRGSAVHEYAASLVTGGYAIPLRPEWQGYADSFRLWADTYLGRAILAEERLVDTTYGFCGQMDLVCTVKGRIGAGLIDLKTGGKAKTHAMQVAAYRYLAKVNGYDTAWGMVLRLQADGHMPRVDPLPGDCSLDLNRFLGALNLFNYFQ